MKLPFLFISLRSLVRELRALRSAADRIASALERAYPLVSLEGTAPEEEDVITVRNHSPDEEAARLQLLQALSTRGESEVEDFLERLEDV